jgi:DNA-directed RNA polymerase subunit alpha
MHRNWRRLIKPRGLEFDREEITPTYGRFVAKPLERGFGITLGNSLRRVLLSSLQGAAVTSVFFDGVLHEFTSIPGVKEDMTDIILNIKQLRLKLHEGEYDTIKIDVSGEHVITAKDLIISKKIEFLNPDLYIATVGPEGSLKATLNVKMNKGYVPAEQNKSESDPVGTIAIDSIHTPIVRCNYNVTNARVAQRTDYDKLTIDVTTDGSIRPDDAIAFAAKILKEQLQIFINFEEIAEPVSIE